MLEEKEMHNHIHQHNSNNRRIFFAIILNFLICIVEIIGGILAGSLSLIADAFHNFSDGMAIFISYLARKIGMRSPDLKMTFGYKRAEILAALFNSSVIIVIAFFLFRESYFRLMSPQQISISLMIGVGFFGLIADLICVFLLHPESQHSLNIRSAYLHLLSDTLSSLTIVIAGILIYFYKIYYIDAILTVIIGSYILWQGYQVLKQSVMILMERVPIEIDINKIKNEIELIPNVNNLHHIHIWQINEDKILFEGHIKLKEDMKISEAEKIRERINNTLEKEFNILHPMIQLEFSYCNSEECLEES